MGLLVSLLNIFTFSPTHFSVSPALEQKYANLLKPHSTSGGQDLPSTGINLVVNTADGVPTLLVFTAQQERKQWIHIMMESGNTGCCRNTEQDYPAYWAAGWGVKRN